METIRAVPAGPLLKKWGPVRKFLKAMSKRTPAEMSAEDGETDDDYEDDFEDDFDSDDDDE